MGEGWDLPTSDRQTVLPCCVSRRRWVKVAPGYFCLQNSNLTYSWDLKKPLKVKGQCKAENYCQVHTKQCIWSASNLYCIHMWCIHSIHMLIYYVTKNRYFNKLLFIILRMEYMARILFILKFVNFPIYKRYYIIML